MSINHCAYLQMSSQYLTYNVFKQNRCSAEVFDWLSIQCFALYVKYVNRTNCICEYKELSFIISSEIKLSEFHMFISSVISVWVQKVVFVSDERAAGKCFYLLVMDRKLV